MYLFVRFQVRCSRDGPRDQNWLGSGGSPCSYRCAAPKCSIDRGYAPPSDQTRRVLNLTAPSLGRGSLLALRANVSNDFGDRRAHTLGWLGLVGRSQGTTLQPPKDLADTTPNPLNPPLEADPMSNKHLVIVIAVVALLSAGLGVVVTSQMAPKEVKVSLDLGNGKSLNLGEMAAGLGNLEGARIRANEGAAIAILRSIASAQAQAQSSAVIDADGDGAGEFAYLGEMAGTAPLRLSGEVMYPALLVSSLGNITPEGIATRSGYNFRVFLPGATVDGKSPGLPEGSGVVPDSDGSEILWCAYAWPTHAGTTGTRVFFMSHEGEMTETANADHAYDGEGSAPAFDAALSSKYPHDLGSLIPMASLGQSSNDGRLWSSVGH